jgi:hypothetical protein
MGWILVGIVGSSLVVGLALQIVRRDVVGTIIKAILR